MALWILLGIVVVLGFWLMGAYNSLVRLRNAFKNAFAQIDVQLKRRYDLIPNLVETAKSYMAHEKETLEAVIRSRNSAFAAVEKASQNPADSTAVDALAQADQNLTANVGRLMAVMESYPDLKANTSMNQLMEELSSTENRVAFARQAFNDGVMAYNTAREVFPNVLVAGALGFAPATLLQATETAEERQAPKVSFT